MVEVATIIPSDMAVNLLRNCGTSGKSGNISEFFQELVKKHPNLVSVLRSNLKISKQ
jgi:hypothetical protein